MRASKLTGATSHGMFDGMFSSVVHIYRHKRLMNNFAQSEAVLHALSTTTLTAMLI